MGGKDRTSQNANPSRHEDDEIFQDHIESLAVVLSVIVVMG
jgi:hypothetical protein